MTKGKKKYNIRIIDTHIRDKSLAQQEIQKLKLKNIKVNLPIFILILLNLSFACYITHLFLDPFDSVLNNHFILKVIFRFISFSFF
jgi:hypothetical protein